MPVARPRPRSPFPEGERPARTPDWPPRLPLKQKQAPRCRGKPVIGTPEVRPRGRAGGTSSTEESLPKRASAPRDARLAAAASAKTKTGSPRVAESLLLVRPKSDREDVPVARPRPRSPFPRGRAPRATPELHAAASAENKNRLPAVAESLLLVRPKVRPRGRAGGTSSTGGVPSQEGERPARRPIGRRGFR